MASPFPPQGAGRPGKLSTPPCLLLPGAWLLDTPLTEMAGRMEGGSAGAGGMPLHPPLSHTCHLIIWKHQSSHLFGTKLRGLSFSLSSLSCGEEEALSSEKLFALSGEGWENYYFFMHTFMRQWQGQGRELELSQAHSLSEGLENTA